MATKAQLVDDIILRITKGAPSDDLELEASQIAFWFDLVGKKIGSDYYNSKLKKGESINSDYITIEDNIPATVENVTMLDQYRDRVYIEIASQPMELSNDRGIIRIITAEGTVVNKISLENLDVANNLTFGAPQRENLLYTRIGQKIYVHGLSPKHVRLLLFSVFYIKKIDLSSQSDSEIVTIPDDLIALISDAVYEYAMKELYGGVADIENDAEDDTTPTK